MKPIPNVSEEVIDGKEEASEKLGAVAVAPEPVIPAVAPAEVKVMLEAICPVCGRSIPERRVTRWLSSVAVETQPYFDSIEWDENKPFGVALSAAGRGSLRDWNYITPEEAPELFEAVKARLIQAVKEWVAKGWIAKEEILG